MKNKVYNLFEICNPKQWKTISIDNLDKNGKYPVYGANGIIGYYSEYNHEKPTLCITCRGATSGELIISTSYSYINGNTMALDGLDETKVDINFLYYYLKKRGFKDIISGSAQPQITRISLKKINIPLYTLSFQKKVASDLKKAEDIITFYKNQLLNLTELVKSLFTKYSIGEKESIANLCYVKARIGWQGLTKKEYLSDGEYYLITGVDFKNEKIDFKNCFHITEQRYNQDENIKVKINDILLTKDGTIGKVAIVDKLEKPASLNSGVFVLRPKVNNLNVIYLMHSLISDDFKKFIDDIKIGATVPHLNQTALLKYKVILPPIELQNKFAERVEKIEKLKFEIEKSIEEAKKLYDSLIFKYFDN